VRLVSGCLYIGVFCSALFSQVYSGQISVDGRNVVRRIPTSLYGANLEWVYNLWGAWNPSANNLEPRASSLVRGLAPTVLRFPGGIFSDFYRWRDGVGPLSTRLPARMTNTGEVSPNGFGTDEALALADSIGARLMITVNVGTGSPEEAAAWVRYVNAREPRVLDWELGNELYSKSTSAAAAQVTMSPDTYARRVLEFSKAMRAADPRIRIGVIAGESTGIFPLVEYPDWNRIVLQRTGSVIDFVAVHNAYAPIMMFDRNEDLETVYRAMLASTSWIADSLRRISMDIAQFAPAEDRDRIRIAVTEWGPAFHFSPLSRFVDHPKTLASALFTAGALMTFLAQPRVDTANFFKLFDNSFSGLIGRRNGDWQEVASYHALRLFRHHFGSHLLASTVTSPVFRSEASGIVPALDNNPDLQCVASLNADGTQLYLMVLNKHLTDHARVTVRVTGVRLGAPAVVHTLNGTGIDAHTGTQLPFPEWIPWAPQATATSNPRFNAGAPGQVAIATTTRGSMSETFEHVFPAHSLTAVEIPVSK
jgi:alpha-L-arabinofuranosidase